jgi:PAS domain S-box-containing protein
MDLPEHLLPCAKGPATCLWLDAGGAGLNEQLAAEVATIAAFQTSVPVENRYDDADIPLVHLPPTRDRLIPGQRSIASSAPWGRVLARALAFLAAALASAAVLAAPRVVRVGVYDNPPKILAAAQGQPSGILGDLLLEVARQEQWIIEPVACGWEQCLRLLETRAIDVLPDVAYTEERARRFDFHRVPALPSWSQVYRRGDVTLQSVLDLNHKRVAVLEGSVQQSHLAGLLASFNLKAELLSADSFEEAFAMVASGHADAVAANRYSGDRAAGQYGLQATALVFLPSKLFYATPKGEGADLLTAIDAQLAAWQSDADSFYFQTLARWGQQGTHTRVPVAFWWGLAAVVGLLVLALGFLALLRREVARQTRALRESEERLRMALAAASQGLYDLDLRTGQAAVSPEYATMLGFDPQTFTLTLNSWLEYLHPDDRPRVSRAFEDYVAGRSADYRVEFRQRTHDGRWKWILSLGKIQAYDVNGRPVRMLGTHTDIDAIKAAQAALLELNATLESRVTARTAELTAANQELDSFVYAVSHDLRAPLRAMMGFSGVLAEDLGPALPPEAKSHLDHIVQAGRKMSALVEGLLTLSRSARGPLQLHRVDVSALASARLAELAAAEPARQVAVSVEDGLLFEGDERLLASVVDNLLDNAWKYTGGTAQASIRVQACEEAGYRGFSVIDNGAGFDMAHATRLFQAFQRLHRQDEFPGIGIGLATVQRIVQRHGGYVTATAEPGKGAVFSIWLPMATVAPEESETP